MSISIKVEKLLGLESSVSQLIWSQKPPDEHFRNIVPQASSGYSYYMKMNRLLLYFNKHPKWLLFLGQLGEHSSLMDTESQKLTKGCHFSTRLHRGWDSMLDMWLSFSNYMLNKWLTTSQIKTIMECSESLEMSF